MEEVEVDDFSQDAVHDKYIGLALAISSSIAIGTSFVITKRGLMETAKNRGFEGEGYSYLRNPIWWAGMVTMVMGEAANFAAYAFAPAILVTPLGALSVLIGAVLGAYFLQEELGRMGWMGCALCLVGSVIIVLHAPADQEVETIDEILNYAIQPGFLIYMTLVTIFALVMIYRVAPKHGKENPIIYISICSTVGSVSVMAIKAFGIALKLTLAGNNQFTHPSTYVFVIVVVVCIMTQMNYFNKALSQFSTSVVNPIYYVTFTTATIVASLILFKGFNTADAVNTVSLLCGFLVIFSGVYLLNISRADPSGSHLVNGDLEGPPTDPMSGFGTRRSMQLRRSHDSRISIGSLRQDASLIRSYDEENMFALTDLAEDEGETNSDGGGSEDGVTTPALRKQGHGKSGGNGNRSGRHGQGNGHLKTPTRSRPPERTR